MTIVHALVDDWYQAHGVRLVQGKADARPVCGDSEVITLLLLMDFLPLPSEH